MEWNVGITEWNGGMGGNGIMEWWNGGEWNNGMVE